MSGHIPNLNVQRSPFMRKNAHKLRSATDRRRQWIFFLQDVSPSMQGEKLKASQKGLKQLIELAQQRTGHNCKKEYYNFLCATFAWDAQLEERYCFEGVLGCSSDVEFQIRRAPREYISAQTNIYAGLKVALPQMEKIVADINRKEDAIYSPIPIVMLATDGVHTALDSGCPVAVAEQIKSLKAGGEPVQIAVAAALDDDTDEHDIALLRRIASPDAYFQVRDFEALTHWIADIGSRVRTSSRQLTEETEQIRHEQEMRRLEDKR